MVSDDSPQPLPNCIPQGASEEVNGRKQNFTMSIRYLERQVEKGIVCHHSHATKTHSISSSLSPRNLSIFPTPLGTFLLPPSHWSGNEPNHRGPEL